MARAASNQSPGTLPLRRCEKGPYTWHRRDHDAMTTEKKSKARAEQVGVRHVSA